jgi:thiol:disulfide interchange protein
MKTKTRFKQRLLTTLLGLILIASITQNVQAKTGDIDWKDYEEGIELAKAENKTIIIDFYTDWCSWCDRMDDDTYSDPPVIDKSSDFICIKVDGDKRKDLVNKYNIEGYPTTVFLNATGAEVHKVEGYVDGDEFYDHMRFALGEMDEPPESSTSASPCYMISIIAIALVLLVSWVIIRKR